MQPQRNVDEGAQELYQPRPRVPKGYTRRGRPSKKDPAVNVADAPVDAPSNGAPIDAAPAVASNRGRRRTRPVNGAPETEQVMRRAARKAIKQREPLVEGTVKYQALLQEARDHHAACPIYRDQELGKLTNLNLFNPNKRSKAMPQEVGSKTKMAKDLFHNYLKVVTLNK
ncbi:hypothetical protein B9Z55_026323 [Caenorhabditis nigoni]|uniref:Uncharacterized protein n=1 Tax=Caenorhabditis nigoni TaxID=1611254 RepID=A0A2G5T344_9PELO|nr:hypothetical protein B9Z55_026323 [Caenorhabditis nigoni]